MNNEPMCAVEVGASKEDADLDAKEIGDLDNSSPKDQEQGSEMSITMRIEESNWKSPKNRPGRQYSENCRVFEIRANLIEANPPHSVSSRGGKKTVLHRSNSEALASGSLRMRPGCGISELGEKWEDAQRRG